MLVIFWYFLVQTRMYDFTFTRTRIPTALEVWSKSCHAQSSIVIIGIIIIIILGWGCLPLVLGSEQPSTPPPAPPFSCRSPAYQVDHRSSIFLCYYMVIWSMVIHHTQYNSPAVLLHIKYTALLYLLSGQWSSITTLSTTIDYFSHLLIFICLLTHQPSWPSLTGMSWSLCAKPCSSRTWQSWQQRTPCEPTDPSSRPTPPSLPSSWGSRRPSMRILSSSSPTTLPLSSGCSSSSSTLERWAAFASLAFIIIKPDKRAIAKSTILKSLWLTQGGNDDSTRYWAPSRYLPPLGHLCIDGQVTRLFW